MGMGMSKAPTIAYWLVVFVAALALGSLYLKMQTLSREGRQAHAAICTLRSDLERRTQDSRDFLKQHPDGIPGIPASLIRNSIKNQQQTIDALRAASC